jgi:hypothetical protein
MVKKINSNFLAVFKTMSRLELVPPVHFLSYNDDCQFIIYDIWETCNPSGI